MTFKTGDTIKLMRSDGYYNLTSGKTYVVEHFEPEYHDPTSSSGFTWPPLVTVVDDNGNRTTAHASRFQHA